MAITQTYVDYGAGNDATGDGSVGTPWKTLQWAFDHLTRNTTDGNQVNLKAGTAHVNAAALNLTTFVAGGALSATAPLILRGYTTAANDGGIGEIDCGGATMWAATYNYLIHVDLEIHTGGNNHLVSVGGTATFIGCELHKGASSPSGKILLNGGYGGLALGCYFHDAGAGASKSLANFHTALNCYVITDASATNDYGFSDVWHIRECIIHCRTTGTMGCAGTMSVINSVMYSSVANTASGIRIGANAVSVVLNNILVGFSGAGGEGVYTTNPCTVGYNAFYNNAANYVHTDQVWGDLTAFDVALAADPFTDAANGDFSLTTAGQAALRSLGWPATYLGAHAGSDPHITIGAMQYGPTPTGGGGAVGIFPVRGVVGL